MSGGREQLATLMQGLREDLAACVAMRDLLEAQFAAVLHQRTDDLMETAQRIAALGESMRLRRRVRQGLVRSLSGNATPPGMNAVLAALPPALRPTLESWHGQLQQQMRECKTLNQRNGRLLGEQHALMQRVLGVDRDTYAPA